VCCGRTRQARLSCKLTKDPNAGSHSRQHCVGTWLSLVEHSLGVRGVGSSNLPVPTNLNSLENFVSLRQDSPLTADPRRAPGRTFIANAPVRPARVARCSRAVHICLSDRKTGSGRVFSVVFGLCIFRAGFPLLLPREPSGTAADAAPAKLPHGTVHGTGGSEREIARAQGGEDRQDAPAMS
jgi:hypothetical protein